MSDLFAYLMLGSNLFRYVNSNQTSFYVLLCVNSSPVIPVPFRAALNVNRPVNTQTHILWHTHIDLLSSSLNTLSGSSLCTGLTLSLFDWCFHPSLPLFSLNWGPLERSGLIVSIWECRVWDVSTELLLSGSLLTLFLLFSFLHSSFFSLLTNPPHLWASTSL